MRTRTCLPGRCWQIARAYGDCDREAEVRPIRSFHVSPTSLDLSAIIPQNFTSVHLSLPIRGRGNQSPVHLSTRALPMRVDDFDQVLHWELARVLDGIVNRPARPRSRSW